MHYCISTGPTTGMKKETYLYTDCFANKLSLNKYLIVVWTIIPQMTLMVSYNIKGAHVSLTKCDITFANCTYKLILHQEGCKLARIATPKNEFPVEFLPVDIKVILSQNHNLNLPTHLYVSLYVLCISLLGAIKCSCMQQQPLRICTYLHV